MEEMLSLLQPPPLPPPPPTSTAAHTNPQGTRKAVDCSIECVLSEMAEIEGKTLYLYDSLKLQCYNMLAILFPGPPHWVEVGLYCPELGMRMESVVGKLIVVCKMGLHSCFLLS